MFILFHQQKATYKCDLNVFMQTSPQHLKLSSAAQAGLVVEFAQRHLCRMCTSSQSEVDRFDDDKNQQP